MTDVLKQTLSSMRWLTEAEVPRYANRAKAVLVDAKGEPIINPKTRTPKVVWSELEALNMNTSTEFLFAQHRHLSSLLPISKPIGPSTRSM